MISSPTGIAADPALTAHGVEQARDLAAHLRTLSPRVDEVYSSPYYRCLQTVEPFARNDQRGREGVAAFRIRAETGLGEWYGSAPFKHPAPAEPEVLRGLFPDLDSSYRPVIRPPRTGESVDELHGRVAATISSIIAQSDREGAEAILVCSHAAVVIALGRVLTGSMPDDGEIDDFRAFTCGLSVYRRRTPGIVGCRGGARELTTSFEKAQQALATHASARVEERGEPRKKRPDSDAARPLSGGGDNSRVPPNQGVGSAGPARASGNHGPAQGEAWKGGKGVAGGWDCLVNSDCSFLREGEERGWCFSGDEAFTGSGQPGDGSGPALDVVRGGKAAQSSPEDVRKARL